MSVRPNVFTIPAGTPFLDTLVQSLLAGRLVRGFTLGTDPFALADLTLYLPTRRAARAVRDSFLRQAGRPVLLPRIRTLGDFDEDEELGEVFPGPELPPAISTTERQLVLTGLVMEWGAALARAHADLPAEEFMVPASPADAARLAGALGRLIDQVGTEPEAWSGLFAQVPADLARYWEITLEFLRIATEAWPAYLAEHQLMDLGARRDRLVRAEADRLARQGSPFPVIAAGSTGSVPSTAALLGAIARLQNGAVVLPGLDTDLDPDSWAEIGPSEREPAGAGHPQFGLKLLLDALGVRREDVEPLGQVTPDSRSRAHFVSEAMRPAGTTERWTERNPLSLAEKGRALEAVNLVEAANEREEALAVAAILRGAIEQPGQVAALVTPDRGLARRVAVELRRWEITVDDSAGRPLTNTPAGVLARLTADVALGGADPSQLLALAKHPLATFGMDAPAVRRAARALERAVLRGSRLRPGLQAIRSALDRLMPDDSRVGDGRRRAYPTNAARGLSQSAWRSASTLLDRVVEALGSFEALGQTASLPLSTLVEAHIAAFRATTRLAPDSLPEPIDESREALENILEGISAAAGAGPDLTPRDYPALFTALIDGASVRRRGGLDPRVHIWGALEARLQRVDVVVLGSLNEGTWPGQTRLDPLLSRPMRAALALEPPERRIGLSAHDFAQALGHPVVWLTRADRENGEPRVASRWLQRLTAYAGEDLSSAMRARGRAILAATRGLDRAAHPVASPRPAPNPPMDFRPGKLSVTQIETLIRDPYAIYAQKVLRLRRLEPLAEPPGPSDRGNLVHAILERFVRERPSGPFDRSAEMRLIEIGREEFATYRDFPEIGTLWWPRFERIARWFIREEAKRSEISERLVEGKGSWTVTDGFELTARADRLDRLTDGRIGIVDYKTGTPPGPDQVLALAPQLPLEALMVQAGAFPQIGTAQVARLEYYHISGRGEGGSICARGDREKPRAGKPAVSLPQALVQTETRLKELVAYYQGSEAQYLSRKIPRLERDYGGDYDHLARVGEWSVGDTVEDL